MIDRLAARCRTVLCGNDYIAAHFSRFAPVKVLPTGVDTDRWVPGERAARPTLVWSGSAGGLPYLYAIEAPLARLLAAVPDARLRVVCNAAPKWARLDPARVEFVPWSPSSEVAAVQSAWVGLMPMPDTPWTRGKCSFKMLTYLACGVPAVASPYGMNAQVIAGGGAFGAESDDDWIGQLLALLGNDGAAREAGRVGRQQIERQYSAALIGTQLAQALREAAT
nr:glycosyltransferase family 4 protein [Niveibacterium umoris]